jgi:hypothetical protein
MLERLQADLNITEGEEPEVDGKLNDAVNDAYGLLYSLSNFVSPLIGTFLRDKFGSPQGTDYIMYANILIALILFIFNCGPFVFAEERKF